MQPYNLLPLNEYDKIVVYLSGGKDSIAATLSLLKMGIPTDKIELHHQDIDSGDEFFDWPSVAGYVSEFAKPFNLKLCTQGRKNGFYGELTRNNSPTNDCYYQYENEEIIILPTKILKLGTREKFPAKSADLSKRWCSAYLKIDVGRRCLKKIFKNNMENPMKILTITGERREESSARAKYNEIEVHSGNNPGRLVHHWRMVIDLTENDIWSILEEFSVLPHPAYYLGFPRLSCMTCIFFTPDLWATIFDMYPESVYRIKEIEDRYNHTLDNKYTIMEMVAKGKSKITDENRHYIKDALSPWNGKPIITNDWKIPTGAYGKGGGSI